MRIVKPSIWSLFQHLVHYIILIITIYLYLFVSSYTYANLPYYYSIYRPFRIRFKTFLYFANIIWCLYFFIYYYRIIKNHQNLGFAIFAVFLRQHTICLFSKNGLESILVRRFFSDFSAFFRYAEFINILVILDKFYYKSYI